MIDKIKNKEDFTETITNDNDGRYVVSMMDIYKGKEPLKEIYSITKLVDVVKNCDGLYDSIGGWTDKDTGVYYVDANMHCTMLDIAIKLAKVNNQLAIFDLKTNKEIRL